MPRLYSRRHALAAGAAGALAARFAAADEKTYKACVIGHTGRGNYGHGLDKAFQGFSNITVAAVADPNEKGRDAALKRTGAQRAYADYREMLEKEKPQLVSLGMRWVEKRLEMITAIAESGAHVFMEKPIAESLEEADAIIAVAEKHKIKIAVGHHMRLVPAILHLKKSVDDGLLGEILEVRTRGKEDHRAGGEDLMVLGTHCLYLMRLFCGEPQWCSARVTQNGKDITREDARAATEPLGPVAGDTIHATYAFANGVQGFFDSQKARKTKDAFQCVVYGSKGVAQFIIDVNAQIFWLNDPAWHPGKSGASWQPLPGSPPNECDGLKGFDGANRALVKEWLREIEGGGESAGSIYHARRTLEMIMAVYASHLKGARVPFPLAERKHPLV
ncbi:MAG TPA: Gfo/Idh/MocA family oxidoreductase [Planctomycetota bacterium]|nr:Gfo/Idh/MocA family oxidoreductase [Planctomycetota bacterium]